MGCAYPTDSHERKLSFIIIMSIYFRYNYAIFVYAVERQISMSFIDRMILHSVFGTFATGSYEQQQFFLKAIMRRRPKVELGSQLYLM